MGTSNRFIQNISANAVQMILSQCFGLTIFYVLSKQFDKATFGDFNWSLAVLLTSFGILSCGLDQLAVKKIATGQDPNSVISLYLLHSVIAVGLFYIVMVLTYYLLPSNYYNQQVLLLLSLGKALIFFSVPFKQVCAGLERFRPILYMSSVSNAIRATCLLLLFSFNLLSVQLIIAIFIAADLSELVASILISRKYLLQPAYISFNIPGYKDLFKEVLPQLGTVILSALMARMDWILIGIILSATKLAEYSFAYKVFEVSSFPLLIIAPVLIPSFAKVFNKRMVSKSTLAAARLLVSVEMAIASLTSLILVIIWVPVVDYISDGKYGKVNHHTIFILSLSLPFLYFNNFMWTIEFSRSRLSQIFRIFATTFIINIVADVVLIQLFANEGAAAGYLLALLTQSIYFIKTTKNVGFDAFPMIALPVSAFASGIISFYFFSDPLTILVSSIFIYLICATYFLRPARKNIKNLRSILEE